MNVAVALLSALVVLPPMLVWADKRNWVSRGLHRQGTGALHPDATDGWGRGRGGGRARRDLTYPATTHLDGESTTWRTRLVIKGGTVHDGSGAAGTRADVGIADGRITEIGPNLDGDRVLDAGDCVVAPGFIDIHTHYDAQVFWDPALTPSCYHGVTTVVAGNCGFSIAPTRAEHHELIARTLENVEDMDVAALAAGIPWDFATFPEYLASVANHGVGINFAAYIGHTALRLFVMGDDAYERTATAEEIAAMQQVLREAMDAGAAGFATSFAFPHRGHRRQAGAQPVRRPGRARGAARDDGGGRPGCGVDRARRAVRAGRHVRPPDEGRRAVHVGRAAHVAHRVPPPGDRGEPGRVGARLRGVAAGDAAAAHLPVHPRLAVPARGQRALRRAAERVDRRAHSGLRRPRVARGA